MPLVCKWNTTCSRCGDPINEGDDLWLVDTLAFGREKICWICARMDGRACECGNDKKQEHRTCWECKIEQDKRDGKVCACGAWKKPQYETCWSCKNKPKEDN